MGILGHVLTWIFCGCHKDPQNNSEGNPASQVVPGSSTQKNRNKPSNNYRFIVGLPKKDFL